MSSWIQLDWNPWVLALMVVLSIIVYCFAPTWGVLLGTYVLHASLNLNIWSWLHVLAWIVWLIALVCALLVLVLRMAERGWKRMPKDGALWVAGLAFAMVMGFILFDLVAGLVHSEWSWNTGWFSWPVFWLLIILAVVCFVLMRFILSALMMVVGVAVLVIALLLLSVGLMTNHTTLGDHHDNNVATPAKGAISVQPISYQANNLQVSFNASATGPAGDVLGYSWNFGDGSSGTGTPASHSYTKSGTYTVSVTVGDTTHSSVPSASQSVSLTVKKAKTLIKQVGVDSKKLGHEVTKIYKGYKPGQLKFGTGHIPNSTREAATLSFSNKTLATPDMLADFLKSDDRLAQQTQQRIRAALLKAGYDHKEVQRALGSADHWFWVAPTVASQISGTTYPIDGKVIQENGFRSVAPNDAMWYYVTSDGKIVKGASVRADCGNGSVKVITPIPPGYTPPSIACVTNCGQPPTCQSNCHPVVPTCKVNCHPKKCDCVTPTKAAQPVPTPAKAPSGTPTKAPTKNPVGPKPVQGSPAPAPIKGGYDSGSTNGSGTPGGTACDSSGCQGGGSSPGQGDGGAGTGSTSGDTNTGVVTGP